MREVKLTGKLATARNLVALVDDADYELVSQYRWYARQNSKVEHDQTYAVRTDFSTGTKVEVSMHGFITGYALTDHINGNGLDNRRKNLRPATLQQNSFNRGPNRLVNKTSKYKGVSLRKSGKWSAGIMHNYRQINLGLFCTEEEAARAYDRAARRLFGEFAWTNEGHLLPRRTRKTKHIVKIRKTRKYKTIKRAAA